MRRRDVRAFAGARSCGVAPRRCGDVGLGADGHRRFSPQRGGRSLPIDARELRRARAAAGAGGRDAAEGCLIGGRNREDSSRPDDRHERLFRRRRRWPRWTRPAGWRRFWGRWTAVGCGRCATCRSRTAPALNSHCFGGGSSAASLSSFFPPQDSDSSIMSYFLATSGSVVARFA